tara:strand:+ start:1431 stop:1616 length:186 start_codon:yes stop_codon:yes gene_type:complete
MASKKEKIVKVNPFDKGVTYADLLKAIPKGTKVEMYLKGVLDNNQIEWIKKELESYKNLKK